MASLLDPFRAVLRRGEAYVRTRVQSAASALRAYSVAEAPQPAPAIPSQVPVLDAWDVEDVRGALRDHEYGQFHRSALLADHMRRNDRIAAALNTRLLAATSLPHRLDPAPDALDLDLARAVADDLAPFVRDALARHDAARVVEDVAMLGLSVCQRIPRRDPVTGRWSITLHPWHLAWVSWDATACVYRISTRTGIELCPPDGSNPRWCVFRALGGDRPWMGGAIRALAIPFLIAGWADRDWARWSEKHGLPPLGAKVPYAERFSRATEDFLAALQSLATEPTILLAQGSDGKASFDLEWKELKNWQSYQGFKDLAEYQSTRIAITLLGQNLTTEVQGGSFAAARAHELVRQDYLSADAAMLAEGLRAAVSVPLTRIQHAADPTTARTLAPLPVWDSSAPKDPESAAKTSAAQADAVKAWQDAGVTVDAAAAAVEAGMVVTTPEDDTLDDAPDAPLPAENRAVPNRYGHINFRPPQGVRDACKRGIELHEEGLSGAGLQPDTIAWARRLARGENVSPEKARKMARWFGRNRRFADAAKETPAWVSFCLWGGRAGDAWSAKLTRQMNAADAA